MPTNCCAIGSTNQYRKGGKIKFYHFPSDAQRRNMWVCAMRRDNWSPKEHSRLCNEHFISSNSFIYVSVVDNIPRFYIEEPSPCS